MQKEFRNLENYKTEDNAHPRLISLILYFFFLDIFLFREYENCLAQSSSQ